MIFKKSQAENLKWSLPAMQDSWVRFLGQEDPLEKGKTTHSSILAWGIHGLYSPRGGKEWDTAEKLSLHWVHIAP